MSEHNDGKKRSSFSETMAVPLTNGPGQRRQHLALAADEIAAVGSLDGEVVPFHELLEIADDRFAHVAAINRIAPLIPVAQQREIAAAREHENAFAQVDRVRGGENEDAAGPDDAGDFAKEPARRMVPVLEAVETGDDIHAGVRQRDGRLDEIFLDDLDAELVAKQVEHLDVLGPLAVKHAAAAAEIVNERHVQAELAGHRPENGKARAKINQMPARLEHAVAREQFEVKLVAVIQARLLRMARKDRL